MQHERLLEGRGISIELDPEEANVLWMACEERRHIKEFHSLPTEGVDDIIVASVKRDEPFRLRGEMPFIRNIGSALLDYAQRTPGFANAETVTNATKINAGILQLACHAIDLTVVGAEKATDWVRPYNAIKIKQAVGRMRSWRRKLQSSPDMTDRMPIAGLMRCYNGQAAYRLWEQFEAATAEDKPAVSNF